MAKQTFENAIKQLEKIVQELESGETTLEKALKKYEEGMKLSEYCSGKLDEVEKRITIIQKDKKGDDNETSFDNEGDC
jgi:exodeoxyribonuclease VII small subunit